MPRFILRCDEADASKCLMLAIDALRRGEEGDEWGYWSSADPGFSAYVRFNPASVSVHGVRKDA